MLGKLVITNAIDSPSTRLIAIVTDKDPKGHCCEYLCIWPKENQRYWSDDAVLVSDFGVDVKISGGFIWTDPMGPSVAHYSDGCVRHWQGDSLPVAIHSKGQKLLERFGLV